MDKHALVIKLIEKLEAEHRSLAEAAQNTYEAATHEESEAEDQYDTRGLEASYLAGAQAKRVAEVEQILHTIRIMNLRSFKDGDKITTSAVVELDYNGKTSFCLLLPMGGGLTMDFEGRHIQVITPQSPLGEALMGRTAGDVAVIDVGNETKEYEILAVE